MPDFTGRKVTQHQGMAFRFGLNWVEAKGGPGISLQPGLIHTGGNSGFQALNLAVLLGAKTLILLGYDMQLQSGKRHFFGNHPGKMNKNSNYQAFMNHFCEAAPQLKRLGVQVINCTPGSALECFEKRSLGDVL